MSLKQVRSGQIVLFLLMPLSTAPLLSMLCNVTQCVMLPVPVVYSYFETTTLLRSPVADPGGGGAPGARPPPLFSEEKFFFFKYLLFAKQDSDLLRIQSTFERR